MLDRIVESGRNRRHNRIVDIVEIHSSLSEQIVQHHAVFICGARSLGGNSPRSNQFVTVKNAVLDVGVAYIHCENHTHLLLCKAHRFVSFLRLCLKTSIRFDDLPKI